MNTKSLVISAGLLVAGLAGFAGFGGSARAAITPIQLDDLLSELASDQELSGQLDVDAHSRGELEQAFDFDAAEGRHPGEQSLGFYAHGRLQAASEFPVSGTGFVKILRGRGRGYGAELTVATIQEVARTMADRYRGSRGTERIQVGDIANHRGGRCGGHISHQNGLDADIVYLRARPREQNASYLGGFVEKFVSGGRVTSFFVASRNLALLDAFVTAGHVNRIFVDVAIKRALCARAAASRGGIHAYAETLRRLRPLKHHHDHFHVRFDCPEASRLCVRQKAVPQGTGCAQADLELSSSLDQNDQLSEDDLD